MEANQFRVVAELPVHASLAPYEPFDALGQITGGKFGLRILQNPEPAAISKLQVILQDLFAAGVTAGISRRQPIKAVFFDMDATTIYEESLVELAAYAGVQQQVQEITERAMAGELEFKEALRARVSLLRGLGVEALRELAGRLTLMPGIREFVQECRRRQVKTFLVSGGFVPLAEVVAGKVGFDGFHANNFGIAQDKLTGEVIGEVVDAEGKKQFLLATCAKLGILPEQVAAVGDGANDLPMLSSAGIAVGHSPKSVLLTRLNAANWTEDHRFLSALLLG